jgi:hypothetical protein
MNPQKKNMKNPGEGFWFVRIKGFKCICATENVYELVYDPVMLSLCVITITMLFRHLYQYRDAFESNCSFELVLLIGARGLGCSS